jgi:hypothetical protein
MRMMLAAVGHVLGQNLREMAATPGTLEFLPDRSDETDPT